MHWSEDGKIEITRNFAIGTAAVIVIVSLAIVTPFIIGMLVAGDRDRESGIAIPVTPSILANEQGIETTAEIAIGEEATELLQLLYRRTSIPKKTDGPYT